MANNKENSFEALQAAAEAADLAHVGLIEKLINQQLLGLGEAILIVEQLTLWELEELQVYVQNARVHREAEQIYALEMDEILNPRKPRR